MNAPGGAVAGKLRPPAGKIAGKLAREPQVASPGRVPRSVGPPESATFSAGKPTPRSASAASRACERHRRERRREPGGAPSRNFPGIAAGAGGMASGRCRKSLRAGAFAIPSATSDAADPPKTGEVLGKSRGSGSVRGSISCRMGEWDFGRGSKPGNTFPYSFPRTRSRRDSRAEARLPRRQ